MPKLNIELQGPQYAGQLGGQMAPGASGGSNLPGGSQVHSAGSGRGSKRGEPGHMLR